MTLCIAALSPVEDKIITVSDFKLGTEKMSYEPGKSKVAFLGKGRAKWAIMWAGVATYAWSITHRISKQVGEKILSLGEMSDIAQTAFQDELEDKINAAILSRFGLTRKEFTKEGSQYLTENISDQLSARISEAKLDTAILVGNAHHLFSVHDPGIVHCHDPSGFYAIGTGSTLARASLTGNFQSAADTPDAIYRLLTAKFSGESADGVGRKTFLTVMDGEGKCEYLPLPKAKQLRDIWEKSKSVPRGAKAAIKTSLRPTALF